MDRVWGFIPAHKSRSGSRSSRHVLSPSCLFVSTHASTFKLHWQQSTYSDFHSNLREFQLSPDAKSEFDLSSWVAHVGLEVLFFDHGPALVLRLLGWSLSCIYHSFGELLSLWDDLCLQSSWTPFIDINPEQILQWKIHIPLNLCLITLVHILATFILHTLSSYPLV